MVMAILPNKPKRAQRRTVGSVAQRFIDFFSLKEVPWAVLDGADAIIFGCPTYMGDVSSVFKKFMEESPKVWAQQKWADKLAAGF